MRPRASGAIVAALVVFVAGCGSDATSATTTVAAEPDTTTGAAEPDTTAAEPTLADEVYGLGGDAITDRRQSLDVYLPTEGEAPYPTIVAWHGGGFMARSNSLYEPYAGHFTDQGYALVAANYRFLPNAYPAQVEDAFCALAWVHANASEFGFDRDQIFLMGDSAGGYLAAMVGTVPTPELYQGVCPNAIPTSNPPKGAVVMYGFFDLTSMEAFTNPGALPAYMGGNVDELPPERLAAMSPMSLIDGDEPPFLMVHGTEDRDTQSWASEDFAAALKDLGVDASVFLVEEGHAFFLNRTSPSVEASLAVIDEFLDGLRS